MSFYKKIELPIFLILYLTFVLFLIISPAECLAKDTQSGVYAKGKENKPLCLVCPTARKREVFLLHGVAYITPKQWQGRRITSGFLNPLVLKMIPRALVHEGKELYLAKEAKAALQIMAEAARKDGIFLQVDSAYRSKNYQASIFTRMLEQGRTFQDIVRYVAPPGYSEHALGTAVDFYPSNWRFASTAEYSWLKKNANTFHFFESYPKNKSIPWESWHWRWQGEN